MWYYNIFFLYDQKTNFVNILTLSLFKTINSSEQNLNKHDIFSSYNLSHKYICIVVNNIIEYEHYIENCMAIFLVKYLVININNL